MKMLPSVGARMIFLIAVFAQVFSLDIFGQSNRTASKPPEPSAEVRRVTQIDAVGLKRLLKPNGKPLMVNFWATWCEPCREEFPDLVQIDAEYKGKIDFVTVSLDDLAEINRDVPKFLAEMKAEMPTYLLKTPDEDAAIASIATDWKGGLPFTILYNEKGGIAYFRQGKIKLETVKAKIDELLGANASKNIVSQQIIDLPIAESTKYSYETGIEQARRDLAVKRYTVKRYGLTPAIPREQIAALKTKYGIEINDVGCLVPAGYAEYVRGYNEVMKSALSLKFGAEILQRIDF